MAGNGLSRQLAVRYYSDTSLFPGGFPTSTAGSEGVIYIDVSSTVDEISTKYLWNKPAQRYISDGNYDNRIAILEDKNETIQLYEDISGKTNGFVATYTNINISQKNWSGQSNAFLCEIQGGELSRKTLFTASGTPIATAITTDGEYALNGTPSATDYAICWLVSGKQSDFATASIPEDKIVQEFEPRSGLINDPNTGDILPENDGDNLNMRSGGYKDDNVSTAILLGDSSNTSFNTTNKTIVGAVNELEQIRDIEKEPTGFTTPEDVVVTGDGTARTITLSGTVNAYYRGELNATIINGWESPAHGTDTNEQYFLSFDGTTIDWQTISTMTDDFYSELLIAFAFYNPTDGDWVYVREVHGVMPWQTHRELHKTIGTFRDSGGTLADYTLSSTTPANRRPSISSALLYDEDNPTTNLALPVNTYTQYYLSGAGGSANFITAGTDIVPLSTNQPYWNEFTGGAWQQTLMSNNYHMVIWVISIPMALGTDSQKLRWIFAQGQEEFLRLADAQALTSNDYNVGALSGLTPESVFTTKIIIKYTGGNWQLIEVNDLTGTRLSQAQSPTGNYLSSVATDTTLTGIGTVGDPLGIDLNNANSWTAKQIFGNIGITANTISSEDTNGNINITPNGTGDVVLDTGFRFNGVKETFSQYTDGDTTYPVRQNVNLAHDLIYDLWDVYWDGSDFRSSSLNGNFAFIKTSNSISLVFDDNVAQGTITTLSNVAMSWQNSGEFGIGESNPETLIEMTGIAPYFTSHNSTHEDTDNGRESRWIAKGEQSGGEETTLGYQEFSHDGSSDDEKGQLRTYLNDGSDGDTPTLVEKFTSDGNKILPKQCSFSAYNSVDNNNITGDGTTFTVEFDTEEYDIGGDYNNSTDTFTAPVSGTFQFTIRIQWEGTDSGVGHNRALLNLILSNGNKVLFDGTPDGLENSSGFVTFGGSISIFMDAGDTASVQFTVYGGTKIVDVEGTQLQTYFTGYLAH